MDSINSANSVRANRGLVRRLRVFVVASGLTAFALGLLSFYGWLPEPNMGKCEGHPFNEALLMTFQLYVLNIGAKELCGVWNWAAAFTAPVATISAVLAVFLQNIETLRQRAGLASEPPDVVFLGCGNNATSIALHKYKNTNCSSGKKQKVVFIDLSPNPLLHEYISQLDCDVCDWHGDALSTEVLQYTNTIGAPEVWIMTGDDKRNIEIAQRLAALRKDESGHVRPEYKNHSVVVNVYDSGLIRALPSILEREFHILFLSIPAFAARQILLMFPPKLPEFDPKTMSPANQLHIAVVGNGDLVEAIVQQAILHLVYSEAPKDCIRITVIGNSASFVVDKLNTRIPQCEEYQQDLNMCHLLPLCELTPIDVQATELTLANWQKCQGLTKSDKNSNPFSAIYVTDKEDISTYEWALRVASLRQLTSTPETQMIVACVSQAEHDHGSISMKEVFEEASNTKPDDFKEYRVYNVFSENEKYPGESVDAQAKLINLAYSEKLQDFFSLPNKSKEADDRWFGTEGRYPDAQADDDTLESTAIETEQSTEELKKHPPCNEMNRQSSRCAADHLYIKLAILYPEEADRGRSHLFEYARENIQNGPWVSTQDDPEKTCATREVQQLMKIEHRRFVVERLVYGWLPLPLNYSKHTEQERERLKFLRLNQTLVPFDKLNEISKFEPEKDRKIVEATREILKVDDLKP